MADTGYNWLTPAHCTIAGTPVDGMAVADGAAILMDVVDLDGAAACELSVRVVEDDTGACNGNVYISILRSDLNPDGEVFQEGPATGPVYADAVSGLIIDPVQDKTRIATLGISPSQVSRFKPHVLNDSGQELTITVNRKLATVPPAS